MTWQIGDSVKTGNLTGYIRDIRGGPDGQPLYIVQSPAEALGECRTVAAAELKAGPPAPVFEAGQRVPFNGGIGTVLERDGSLYAVEVERPRANFKFRHVYRDVPGWKLALGGAS